MQRNSTDALKAQPLLQLLPWAGALGKVGKVTVRECAAGVAVEEWHHLQPPQLLDARADLVNPAGLTLGRVAGQRAIQVEQQHDATVTGIALWWLRWLQLPLLAGEPHHIATLR